VKLHPPSFLPSFSQVRVLVVGDVMLDKYCEGQANRISPEAPVPAVRVTKEFDRLGGAANVALNVRSLGAQCTLMGIIGDDASGRSIASMLDEQGIRNLTQTDSSGVTTQKLRVLSRGQQMIRLDFEQQASDRASRQIASSFKLACKDADIVILSDYAKGCLSQCQDIIQVAIQLGKPVVVDPKGADFGKYRGATLITPNLSEFDAVAESTKGDLGGDVGEDFWRKDKTEQDADERIAHRAHALCEGLGLNAILVTRSEKGMSLIQRHGTDLHLPTAAREVFDVTGAGDTVVATLASAIGAGMSLQDATQLSNLAAGIAVAKVGTAAVTMDELASLINASSMTQAPKQYEKSGPSHTEQKLVSQNELREKVLRLKHEGKAVVMTNGCFDILHPGHISYLESARALGDVLVVALNSDSSVRTLKGVGRPVNPLESRLRLLGALSCVDLVTSFDEQTPESLISRVLPTILVKGGDYTAEQIAGAVQVQESGGRVVVLDFLEGHSTSRLIEKIKSSK